MDSGTVNLALKLIQEEYKLTSDQVTILYHRFLADDKEFEKVWKQFKNRRQKSGVDKFKELLSELIN
jgi:tRNA G37 N-methylase Trm5